MEKLTVFELKQIDDFKIISLKNDIQKELLEVIDIDLLNKSELIQSLHSLAFVRNLLKNPSNQLHDARDLNIVINLINNLMLSIVNNGFKI